MLIRLKGEHGEDGFACSTDILNHPDTIDFADGGIATFGGGVDSEEAERAMMRDCYQVKTISSFPFIAFLPGSSQRSPGGGQPGVGR